MVVTLLALFAGCGGEDEQAAIQAGNDFINAQTKFISEADALNLTIGTAATVNSLTGLKERTAASMGALESAAADMRIRAEALRGERKTVALEITVEADAIVGILKRIIDAGEKGDAASYNAAIEEYDAAIERLNSKAGEWNALPV